MGSLSPQLLAANQIALQYMGTLMSVIFSVAQAVTVRMGHLIGANEIAAAKHANYAGLCISISVMSLFAIIYWLWPNLLISIDLDVKTRKTRSSSVTQNSYLP
ncbi:MATE family efflux transporter [Legionella tunisiensis]|uniref:MATE family efflux transporter n=1 Tax=Legionella tunisiensis TaxID=1034944 RepID=UPI001E42765B|nr:MATE family efflux transporter [Legionella tunisiensis]